MYVYICTYVIAKTTERSTNVRSHHIPSPVAYILPPTPYHSVVVSSASIYDITRNRHKTSLAADNVKKNSMYLSLQYILWCIMYTRGSINIIINFIIIYVPDNRVFVRITTKLLITPSVPAPFRVYPLSLIYSLQFSMTWRVLRYT
jgi:hypothetical protein